MTEVFTTRSRGLVGGPRPTWFPAELVGAAVRDQDRAHLDPRRPRLARSPGGSARRRTPDRRRTATPPSGPTRSPPRPTATWSRSRSSWSTTARCRRTSWKGMELGDQLEVRGPIGGWFVWAPASRGTGRATGPARGRRLGGGPADGDGPAARRCRRAQAPFRLVYSVRDPDQVIYAEELAERAADDGLQVDLLYTRTAPDGSRPPRRPDHRRRPRDARRLGRPAEAPRLRVRADRLRRARHRPAPGARLHQPHDPRRTLRSLRRQP